MLAGSQASPAEPSHSRTDDRGAIFALLIGNFAIAMGTWLPAATMNSLVIAFDEPPEVTGRLISYAAVVVCVGAPLLAVLTNRWGRKFLLVGALMLYVVGHAAFAFASNFEVALVIRVVTIMSAAVFTPQAAAIVPQLVPPDRQNQTMSMLYAGWAIATAFGMPVMSFAADQLSWQAVALLLAFISLVAAIFAYRTLPAGLMINPIVPGDWLAILRNPLVLLLLTTTLVLSAGQFVLFPYITTELKRVTQMPADQIALVLLLFGVAGIVGNFMMSRWLKRIAPGVAAVANGGIIAAGLLLWGSFLAGPATAAVAVAIWGFGFTTGVPMQQARLANAAPLLASAAISLNTSAVYLGQFFGTWSGGRLLAADLPNLLAWTAGGIVILGCAISSVAVGLEAKTVPARI